MKTMNAMNRREFTKALAIGVSAMAAAPLWAADAPARKLKIGHTGITWGVFPFNPKRPDSDAKLEDFVRAVASQGFTNGFECFPQNLEAWDAKGALADLIAKYKLPLTSAYFSPNV